MERKRIPCDWSTFVCVGGVIMYRSILIGWLAAVVLVSSCHLRFHSLSSRVWWLVGRKYRQCFVHHLRS